jgi:hypothetical protein
MIMTSLIVFVGDTTEQVSTAARQYDLGAYLVTAGNIQLKHSGTVYISIGDVESPTDFFSFLEKATNIVYVPPNIWSDKKTNRDKYSAAWFTEHYIKLAAVLHNIPVTGLDVTFASTNLIPRTTNSAQLWIAGCSTTHGTGVAIGQRYQDILQDHLDLPVVDLSCVGSSIAWSGDQILKADINKGDIVVWGITTIKRCVWIEAGRLMHVTPMYYQRNPEFNQRLPLDVFDSELRIYESLTAIQQVDNFCKKIGAYLVMINIHGDLDILSECANFLSFVPVHGLNGENWDSSFLDFGSDGSHPGPKTHKMYATKILDKLSTFNVKYMNGT